MKWFSFSAQLQQLESRLRYSKTDKDAAEKKQRILMEKDLVDFQAKLAEFDVCLSVLFIAKPVFGR